jgi:catechol 2,3-dioxygenase-like lactoylglutathione lyase family enzyme
MTPAEQAVPILPTKDLLESLAFYQGLGFENRGAPPQEWGYSILGRGDIWLHLIFEPDVDPLTTASSCYLYVADASALHDLWAPLVISDRATGRRIVPPVITDYGMVEFAVVDPSGNLLRIGSPVPDAAV